MLVGAMPLGGRRLSRSLFLAAGHRLVLAAIHRLAILGTARPFVLHALVVAGMLLRGSRSDGGSDGKRGGEKKMNHPRHLAQAAPPRKQPSRSSAARMPCRRAAAPCHIRAAAPPARSSSRP